MATLSDGTAFNISLAGVGEKNMDQIRNEARSNWHLRVNDLDASSRWIQIHPAVLFLDVRAAVDNASLLGCGLALHYLTQEYAFDAGALRSALRAAGLSSINRPP